VRWTARVVRGGRCILKSRRRRLVNNVGTMIDGAIDQPRQLGWTGVAGRVQAKQALQMHVVVLTGFELVKMRGLRHAGEYHRHGHEQREAPAQANGAEWADLGNHDGRGIPAANAPLVSPQRYLKASPAAMT
jgi:hypothetical protein